MLRKIQQKKPGRLLLLVCKRDLLIDIHGTTCTVFSATAAASKNSSSAITGIYPVCHMQTGEVISVIMVGATPAGAFCRVNRIANFISAIRHVNRQLTSGDKMIIGIGVRGADVIKVISK